VALIVCDKGLCPRRPERSAGFWHGLLRLEQSDGNERDRAEDGAEPRPRRAHHRLRLGAIRGPRCPGLSATKAPGRARPRCKEPRTTEHSTENVAAGFDLVVAGARDYRAAVAPHECRVSTARTNHLRRRGIGRGVDSPGAVS
jgi:hypothetical protein